MAHPLADAYMALRALESALGESSKDLDRKLRALADEYGMRGGFTTQFGDIVDNSREPAITWTAEDEAVVAWAADNEPSEIVAAWDETRSVTTHHPARISDRLAADLAKRLKLTKDGEIIDTKTGEMVTFAKVTPGKAWWSARLTHEAKADAKLAVDGGMDALVALVTGKELTTGDTDGDT